MMKRVHYFHLLSVIHIYVVLVYIHILSYTLHICRDMLGVKIRTKKNIYNIINNNENIRVYMGKKGEYHCQIKSIKLPPLIWYLECNTISHLSNIWRLLPILFWIGSILTIHENWNEFVRKTVCLWILLNQNLSIHRFGIFFISAFFMDVGNSILMFHKMLLLKILLSFKYKNFFVDALTS